MPDFRQYVRENLPVLRVSGAREGEVIEELAAQLEEVYRRSIANRLSEEEAWSEVKARVASWPALGEELDSALHERVEVEYPGRGGWFQDTWRDLRFGARQLRKSPTFTAIAVITLALGIGANTGIFSLLDAVLLRNLPVAKPSELVWFGEARASGSTNFIPNGERGAQAFSYPFYREFRKQNQIFTDLAAVGSMLFRSHGRVAGGAELEPIGVELVSENYFQMLGVRPATGRLIADADDGAPGENPVAVANYSWWHRRLGGDPSAIGKTVRIGPAVYTIVGVAQPGFFGATVGQSPDLWVPLSMEKEISPANNGLDDFSFQSLHIIARQKPELGILQAQAQTTQLFRQIWTGFLGAAGTQKELENIRHAYVQLTPAATGRSPLRKEFTQPLVILMVVVALVLLIACANVANLLLARASARRREIAVRMSMGAGRSRLIRQLMAESGLLGLSGAALGVMLAWSASTVLVSMVSIESEQVALRVSPDPSVLGFTVAVAFLTVLLFGMAPALRATGFELTSTLREGRGAVSAPGRNRLARGLVVGQVTLSLVLLAGAGLFLRSFANLKNVNPGFDQHHVLVTAIDAGGAGYIAGPRLESTMRRVEQRVGSLPGLNGASFALSVFEGGGWSAGGVQVPERPESEVHLRTDFNAVAPEYFSVMKMPLVAGRGIDDHDTAESPKVAVINEKLARTYFPDTSAIGHRISMGDEPIDRDIEVVGIVKDAKYMYLDEEQMGAVFLPHAQRTDIMPRYLVARYQGDPKLLFAAIRRAVAEVDPNLAVSDTRTLAEAVDEMVLNQRLIAKLSAFFGLLAAFLACIGIYGVMSYGITGRTNEFGLRMALGAKRSNLLWVVLREALVLAAAGAVIGLGIALWAGTLVEKLLYGLGSSDPLALAAATALMIAVALLAGLLPALRATRIDPAVALRHE